MSWLKVSAREAYRAAAADLQNASSILLGILLLTFPYTALPNYYRDLGTSLEAGRPPETGAAYSLFILIFALIVSFQRRKLFGRLSPIYTLQQTLPLRRSGIFISELALGAILHTPLFVLNLAGAITASMEGAATPLQAHLFAQVYVVICSILATLLAQLWAWIANRIETQKSLTPQQFSVRPKRASLLRFTLLSAIPMAPLRFLLCLASIVLATVIASAKFREDPSTLSAALAVALAGISALLAAWSFKPWLLSKQTLDPFLSTLPAPALWEVSGARSWVTWTASVMVIAPFTAVLFSGLPRQPWLMALVFALLFPRLQFHLLAHRPRWAFIGTLSFLAALVGLASQWPVGN